LERDRELAMLMAIGMNKSRVFFTIVWETLFLSMVSMPIGLLLGWGTIAIVGNYGLDLSAYSESLEDYGISNRIFFEVDNEVYAQVPVVLAITAIIASVYPALKALKSKGKGV
jgi:putative ABC transport system permease protein